MFGLSRACEAAWAPRPLAIDATSTEAKNKDRVLIAVGGRASASGVYGMRGVVLEPAIPGPFDTPLLAGVGGAPGRPTMPRCGATPRPGPPRTVPGATRTLITATLWRAGRIASMRRVAKLPRRRLVDCLVMEPETTLRPTASKLDMLERGAELQQQGRKES
jgi:hypothetical protein